MRSAVRPAARLRSENAGRRPVRTPRRKARVRRYAAAFSLAASILTVRSTSAGFRTGAFRLFRVLHRSSLSDHRDLYLTGVLERVLDLLRDVAREPRGLEVVKLLRLHDDADLAARLDSEGLLDSGEAVRHALELLQALDVVRHDLAAGARPRGTDRIGGGDERADHRHRFNVAVVPDHPVDHRLRKAVPLEELAADDRVRPLDLVIDRLADVVQEAGALHRLRVVPRFRREHPGDVRDLDRVTQHVLAVRGAEVQPSEELYEIRVEPTDADLVDRCLGRFLHDLVDLGASFANHLLDACRVNSTVDERTLESALRDLATDRIEA